MRLTRSSITTPLECTECDTKQGGMIVLVLKNKNLYLCDQCVRTLHKLLDECKPVTMWGSGATWA